MMLWAFLLLVMSIDGEQDLGVACSVGFWRSHLG